MGERREEEEEEACVAGREGEGGLGEVVLAAAALTAKEKIFNGCHSQKCQILNGPKFSVVVTLKNVKF